VYYDSVEVAVLFFGYGYHLLECRSVSCFGGLAFIDVLGYQFIIFVLAVFAYGF
jgi:hypothetical protein